MAEYTAPCWYLILVNPCPYDIYFSWLNLLFKEPDLAAIAQREEENHVKAEERYREALKELKSQRLKDHEKQNQWASSQEFSDVYVFKFNQNELIIKPVASLFCRVVNARKKALLAEKERSAKVASLPLPLPNPVQVIFPVIIISWTFPNPEYQMKVKLNESQGNLVFSPWSRTSVPKSHVS